MQSQAYRSARLQENAELIQCALELVEGSQAGSQLDGADHPGPQHDVCGHRGIEIQPTLACQFVGPVQKLYQFPGMWGDYLLQYVQPIRPGPGERACFQAQSVLRTEASDKVPHRSSQGQGRELEEELVDSAGQTQHGSIMQIRTL